MKIIDLLSINKKEMPKCIKHYSGIYVWDKEKGDFFKGTGEGLLQWCVSSFDTQNHFIDEIEIIEEDNKIPTLKNLNLTKIDINKRGQVYGVTTKEIVADIQTLQNWINKIIDYINKEK